MHFRTNMGYCKIYPTCFWIWWIGKQKSNSKNHFLYICFYL